MPAYNVWIAYAVTDIYIVCAVYVCVYLRTYLYVCGCVLYAMYGGSVRCHIAAR